MISTSQNICTLQQTHSKTGIRKQEKFRSRLCLNACVQRTACGSRTTTLEPFNAFKLVFDELGLKVVNTLFTQARRLCGTCRHLETNPSCLKDHVPIGRIKKTSVFSATVSRTSLMQDHQNKRLTTRKISTVQNCMTGQDNITPTHLVGNEGSQGLWKVGPYRPLTSSKIRHAGRNSQGGITVRHRGGGHKRLLRHIEFRRTLGRAVQVQRIEYDPNRSAWIALVKPCTAKYDPSQNVLTNNPPLISEQATHDRNRQNLSKKTLASMHSPGRSDAQQNVSAIAQKTTLWQPPTLRLATENVTTQRFLGPLGKTRSAGYAPQNASGRAMSKPVNGKLKLEYWLSAHQVKVGSVLVVGQDVDIRPGNTSRLCDLPVGTRIHHVELYPGQGAQLLRAAGVSGFLLDKQSGQAIVRLCSGKQIVVSDQCLATVGQCSNIDHHQKILGKAGRSRWLGWRPTVRGVAMNPVDHPHGGGEGKTSGGRPSCSPWGKPTKGYRTKKRV